MNDKEPISCAMYVRVSTDRQEVDNQVIQLEEYARRKGYYISERYLDIISGTKDKRPGFDEMFKDAHKMKFDLVLFWALDRFSRKGTLYTIQKLRELDNLGIGWDSYQEPYIDTLGPWKDVIISLLASIAKMEHDRISERTKAGLVRARLQGKKLGGHCRKYNFKRIWKEYDNEGSITRASKILNYSYGVIYFIVKNDIHDQAAYEKMKNDEYLKKKSKSENGGGVR